MGVGDHLNFARDSHDFQDLTMKVRWVDGRELTWDLVAWSENGEAQLIKERVNGNFGIELKV